MISYTDEIIKSGKAPAHCQFLCCIIILEICGQATSGNVHDTEIFRQAAKATSCPAS
jgi:hypothetical protein